MAKSVSERAPRGTNKVVRAVKEVLSGIPEESRKAVVREAFAKIKESLTSKPRAAKTGGSARKAKAAPRRRVSKGLSRRSLNSSTQSANTLAA